MNTLEKVREVVQKRYKKRKMTPESAKTFVLNGVIRRIEHQFPTDQSGNKSPEVELMFQVVRQAIMDRFAPSYRVRLEDQFSAKKFLRNSIYHAEVCGVDSQWIREILAKKGFVV